MGHTCGQTSSRTSSPISKGDLEGESLWNSASSCRTLMSKASAFCQNFCTCTASAKALSIFCFKPVKSTNPLHRQWPMLSLATALPGSRRPSQYLWETHQLPPKAKIDSKSSILSPRDTTCSVGATCPSHSPAGQMAPLPGNPACDYSKCVAADLRFRGKGHEA